MYNPKLTFYYRENRTHDLDVTSHSHNCYELVYFERADGKLYINNESFPLGNGCIYFAYPKNMHSEAHSNSYNVTFIGFECADFPRHKLPEIVYNIPEHKAIFALLLKIIEEARAQQENYREITSLLLAEILLLTERHTSQNSHNVKSIYYAYNYIHEYFNQSIDFSELAKLTGYSHDRFRHIFSEKYGISPKQLQMSIRLEKAAELLRETNLSITEISQQCGFSTSAQFSKLFRDKFGASPRHRRNGTLFGEF